MNTRVLIVDDDPIVADSLREHLSLEGYSASSAYNADEALAALEQAERDTDDAARPPQPYRVVISDVSMPGTSGMDLLREIARRFPATAVVMLTGYGTIESAVEALRLGAVDYLTKPVIDEELRLSLERAIRQQALVEENRTLKRRLDGRFSLGGIIGNDHRMQRIYELVEAVAPSKTTVLMTGESGTGKSLIAGAIHQQSPRRQKPFVELSCGSIPETLLESELFGHVKGAFTGAHADKIGRFLAADGGTIFLDEINSASPAMQLKLLRVLQERRFEPVGASKTIEVDVRVILASNQALEQLVAAGQFRQDLYYRINVVKIELPPLRERVSDIPILAEHFLQVHAGQLHKTLLGFTPPAMDALRRYSFPGNVRELQNIVERAAVLTHSARIELTDLPANVIDGVDHGLLRALTGRDREPLDSDAAAWVPTPLVDALLEPEKRIILKALQANQWNRQKTADDLAINRTTLYKKMKQLGIDDREERRAG
ncbi:MAG: sigma-54-dependent Fis family transcriptional regulator [Leptolyngbya sp. PLA3]|nr:MAG: sigma-54-dependent Fis family transcriptional regulator [Cyanobacteria bacterium CYA]MCE7967596.1 sigma-54-dependent Fis family transcriptional regulator [Leptolyngbya sp. PL-A3]